MTLRRMAVFAAAVAMIGWVGQASFVNTASHAPGSTTYTGCLGITGKITGKVSKVAAGSSPTKPCKSSEVLMHLSDGDITAITSGTGLSGGDTEGDITLALLPSFQLPQGCAAGKIAAFDGSSWSCGTDVDTDTQYSAGNGLSLTGTQFKVAPCSAGQILKEISGSWACASDNDTTYSASTGLTLGGTSFSLAATYRLPQSCSSGDYVTWNGSAWGCAVPGDITAVTAGTGLTGGATTGSATLDLATSYRLPQSCLSFDVAAWTGTQWQCSRPAPGRRVFSKTDVDAQSVGGASIAIGTSGFPVLTYYNNQNKTTVVACGDTACLGPNVSNIVDSANQIFDTAVAIGSDGFPAIAATSAAGTLRYTHCGDVTCATSASVVVDGSVLRDPAIAIGADGFPVITWKGNAGLRFAHCANVLCTTANLVTPDGSTTGSSSTVVIGADQLPIVAYRDDSANDVKVVHCGDVACSTGNTVTTVDTDQGGQTRFGIAVGTDGLPLIAYQTGGLLLRVAKCNEAACATFARTTYSATNGTGYYASVRIGSDGLPVVASGEFIAVGTQATGVLHCANQACSSGQLNRVDPAEGYGIMMAIGEDGFPVILSYRIGAGASIVVLHCSSTFCIPSQRQ